MHESVLAFIGRYSESMRAPVLEVGSSDVNGSARSLCPEPYTGVDLVDGNGVDLRADAIALPFEAESFATVISTEMLEHALDPPQAIREMVRVLAPDGLLLLTARGNGFPKHNPPDLWRFMPGTLADLALQYGLVRVVEMNDSQVSGRFLVAHKRSA